MTEDCGCGLRRKSRIGSSRIFCHGRQLRASKIPNLPPTVHPVSEALTGKTGTRRSPPRQRWLKPVLVAQIEFLEWTGENHLRHTKFIALREDKRAREVRAGLSG